MPADNFAQMWSARQEGKSGEEILSVMAGKGRDINVKRVERRGVAEREQHWREYVARKTILSK